jgi:DNA-directed RNA polymerase specialized sigma24 family protein
MDLYLMADWKTANVRKAAAADESHNEALCCFDELRGPLRRYLLCAGASPADADDAVQETFLRLYRHLEKSGGFSFGGNRLLVVDGIVVNVQKP